MHLLFFDVDIPGDLRYNVSVLILFKRVMLWENILKKH